MVRRERNHPSVIMWSIGNEIAEQNGPELAKHLRDIVHAEDPTRPGHGGLQQPLRRHERLSDRRGRLRAQLPPRGV